MFLTKNMVEKKVVAGPVSEEATELWKMIEEFANWSTQAELETEFGNPTSLASAEVKRDAARDDVRKALGLPKWKDE